MSDRAAFWLAMVAYALVVVTVWAGWITGSRFHRSTSDAGHVRDRDRTGWLRWDTTAMSAPCQLAAICCRSVQALTRHCAALRNRIVQTIFMEGGSMTVIEPLP